MMRLLPLLVLLFLAACARIGPDRIQHSSNDYNIAIQRTTDQQLLLNLVRLRYRDTPLFLEVSSVASQFRINTAASAGATLRERQIPESVDLGASISYTEQPTVSYSLLRGDDFVQRLLSPVSLDTLLLLYHSGWSIERVLRLCVQRINGVPNAPSASGPTPATAPKYARFLQLAEHLRRLQRKGLLEMGYRQRGEQRQAMLQFAAPRAADPDIEAVRRLLDLPAEGMAFPLVAASGSMPPRRGIIQVETRSLLGVMFFLSHSVDVPGEHLAAGIVTRTRGEDGAAFDWEQVTHGLFRVHYADGAPPGAAVSASYRGRWFYLDDSDLPSKSTFLLLSQLFSLQAGKGELAGPVLTLPVGN